MKKCLAILLGITILFGNLSITGFAQEDTDVEQISVVEEEIPCESVECEEEITEEDIAEESSDEIEVHTVTATCDGADSEVVISDDETIEIYDEESMEALDASREYMTSMDDAATYLRGQMVLRNQTPAIYFQSSDDVDEVLYDLVDMALVPTGNPKEGEYLKYQFGGWAATMSWYTSRGVNYATITYNFNYYTTLEQENMVDAEVARVLDSLALYDATDYQKIRGIYDYICENVYYDYTHYNDSTYTLKYTAYAAIIDKSTVCQGYAGLYYRMATELGIDCTVITGEGYGGRHAWNLVWLGNAYYNVDTTWDSTYAQNDMEYKYFLKCDGHYRDHTRDGNFTTAAFYAAYPVSESDYDVSGQNGSTTLAQPSTPSETEEPKPEEKEEQNAGCTHVMTHHSAVAATETAAGNVEYWSCSSCGKNFSDENGTTEITAISTDKLQHSYGSWTVTKAATCTTTGTKQCVCANCGDKKTETISATGHTWKTTYTTDKLATKTSTGLKSIHCSKCNAIKSGSQVTIPKITGSWVKTSNGWKYVYTDGSYAKNEVLAIGSSKYAFNSLGIMVTGWYTASNGSMYYANTSGVIQTGWQSIGGKWYYFNPTTAIAAKGLTRISGVLYYMNSAGCMLTGWQKVDGKWYYFASSGKALTGWQKIGSTWYYMDPSTCVTYENRWLNNTYYFKAGGAMVKGWYKIGTKWYYFESSGAKATSKWIGGTYYVKADGTMATSEWIGNYYVDANGKWVPNKTK